MLYERRNEAEEREEREEENADEREEQSRRGDRVMKMNRGLDGIEEVTHLAKTLS